MNTQQLSSIGRQVIAIAAVVMGALTAALQGIKLPPAASTALIALGSVILAVEHYVSDPSTGTTPTPPTPTATVPTPPH